jgi:prevent-host-death family protein
MPVFSVLEAKTHLSRLIDAVERGEESEIVIARHGRPVARLVPLARRTGGMRLGLAAGALGVPDDIDQDNVEIEGLFAGDLLAGTTE